MLARKFGTDFSLTLMVYLLGGVVLGVVTLDEAVLVVARGGVDVLLAHFLAPLLFAFLLLLG